MSSLFSPNDKRKMSIKHDSKLHLAKTMSPAVRAAGSGERSVAMVEGSKRHAARVSERQLNSAWKRKKQSQASEGRIPTRRSRVRFHLWTMTFLSWGFFLRNATQVNKQTNRCGPRESSLLLYVPGSYSIRPSLCIRNLHGSSLRWG